MKMNQIRDLIAVAERGSLRSAARHLGLAQPAITRSIRELEHELGVELFERHVTGVVLTQMGQTVLRRARVIQLELGRVKDEINQLRGAGTGFVTIGLSQAPHVALLPQVLKPFRQRFPQVSLRIMETLFPDIEADLQDGTVDFYVGPLAEDSISSEFVSQKLFDNERVIIGRKGHPLSGAKSLSDLIEAKWVSTSVTIDSKAELEPVFERHNLPRPTVIVQAHTALTAIIAIAHSDLLAMLPRQWLSFVKTSEWLYQFTIPERLVAPAIYVVHRARLPLTPASEYLCDLFRRAAANLSTTPRPRVRKRARQSRA